MITFRGQIKVKKQSRKSKILHPVWQITRKKPKNKSFQEILRHSFCNPPSFQLKRLIKFTFQELWWCDVTCTICASHKVFLIKVLLSAILHSLYNGPGQLWISKYSWKSRKKYLVIVSQNFVSKNKRSSAILSEKQMVAVLLKNYLRILKEIRQNQKQR